MSIAFVYNCDIRNNGTAVLCYDSVKGGLGWGNDVVRYTPLGTLPEQELYIYVDDGRDDITWECPKPNAFYAVDTHLGYDYRLWKSKQFDKVYTAQKDGAEKLRKDGINAEWLPLACHPVSQPNFQELMVHPAKDSICGKQGLEKQYDLAFVGYMQEGVPGDPSSHNRLEFLDTMFREYPNSWLTTNCFFEEMALRYVRGRIGLNLSIRQDLNMRFFEVLSTGTAMMSNIDQVGWDDIGFEEGKHFIGYTDVNDAIDKAKYFLRHSDEREDIAKEGHRLVRSNHTYSHRMQRILDDFNVKR
jgi:O-antigen biosynthesis protein